METIDNRVDIYVTSKDFIPFHNSNYYQECNKALHEAFGKCLCNPSLKVAIIIDDYSEIWKMIFENDDMSYQIVNDKSCAIPLFRGLPVYLHKKSAKIKFDNGSVIDIFIPKSGKIQGKYNIIFSYTSRHSTDFCEEISKHIISYTSNEGTYKVYEEQPLPIMLELDEFLNEMTRGK